MSKPADPATAAPHLLRTASLPSRKPSRFKLEPAAEARAALAADLGITAVHALRFHGALTPEGRRDFRLEARLEGEVEQPCAVTLAPVRTRIDETLTRRYLAEMPEPTGDEVELSEEDIEALPEVLDLIEIAREALALALPLWPRAEGAVLEQAQFTAPGIANLRDEDLRPFAGLASLAQKMGQDQGGEGNGGDGAA